MPIQVELPDGSIGEFPDGMPDQEIEAVLRKQFGGPPAAPAEPGISNWDRFKANAEDSFRRGTLAGVGTELAGMAVSEDEAILDMAAMERQRRERYDNMPEWSTLGEGLSALAGQVVGALPSPESAAALPAKFIGALPKIGQRLLGDSVGSKIARRGVEGAVVNTATDPLVQAGSVAANTQDEYDPIQTVLAAPLGFAVGSGTGAAAEWRAISKNFRNFVGSRRGVDGATIDPQTITPQDLADFEASPDLRAAMAANGITTPDDPRILTLEQRLAARRGAEAERALPPTKETMVNQGQKPISVKANAAEVERLQLEKEGVQTGAIDPRAVSTAGRETVAVPERPIAVTKEGQAVVSSEPNYRPDVVQPRAENIQAQERVSIQKDFDLARKAPEYEQMRAGKEAAYADDKSYQDLAARVGEDPAAVVERNLGIPPEQFKSLPDDARQRVTQAAQRQETATKPDDTVYRTSDDALSEGAALYTPASKPTATVEPAGRKQPTDTELDFRPRPYSRAASGTSDRPFKSRDDSASPEQAAAFEQTARDTASAERARTVEDLEERWRQQEQARTSSGESRNAGAEKKYAGQKANNFTNQPKKPGTDKRYETDEFGFVKSSKEGPIRFGDQKMAAKWILNEGHKQSPDQIFEIENHPSGQGFSVKERGRSAPPPDETPPAGGAEAQASTPDNPPKALAAPERAGTSDGPAGGPESQRDTASRSTGPSSVKNAGPAPASKTPTERPADGNAAKKTDDNPAELHSRKDAEREVPGAAKSEKPATETKGKPEATQEEIDFTTRLYSNPFDPEVFMQLLGRPALKLLRETSALVKGVLTPGKTARQFGDAAKVLAFSNRGMLRIAAERNKDIPEFAQLADMLASDPGSGRTVKQTYESAYTQRALGRINQLRDAFTPEQVKNMDFREKVADVLSGRLRMIPDKEVARAAAEARRLLSEQYKYMVDAGVEVGFNKDYFPRVTDQAKILADPKGFMAAAEAAHKADGLPAKEAKQAAEDWYGREMGITDNRFAVAGASSASKATKGRVLSPRADKLMQDFYKRDVLEVLERYFRQTSRITEFQRRFGKNGEKANEMFNAMLKKGASIEDVQLARDAFESSTGMWAPTGRSNTLSNFGQWAHGLGTMLILGRSAFTSLPESLLAGVRSGNALDGLKTFSDALGAITGLKDMSEYRRAAEYVGIIGSSIQQAMIDAPMEGQINERMTQRLAGYFHWNGLVPLTNFQRTLATKISVSFIRNALEDAENGLGKHQLGDLGIDPADAPKILKWLNGEELPALNKLTEDSPEAQSFRSAMQRFVDEAIQNPEAVDRPYLANKAHARMAYGILSFTYDYARTVMLRSAKEVGSAFRGQDQAGNKFSAMERAQLVGVLPALLLAITAQLGLSRVREMITNTDKQKERTDFEKTIVDMSRAQGFGIADPLVNLVLSARYGRDLATAFAGPQIGNMLQDMQSFVGMIPKEYGGKNSERTNNAEWAATKGAYDLFAMSALVMALTNKMPATLPGAVARGVGFAAASSPQASRKAADTLVGERDVQKNRSGGKKKAFAGY